MTLVILTVIFCSTGLEAVTLGQVKWHREMCAGKNWYNYTYAALISFGLSYAMTLPFGAQGTIVMVGGVASTMLSIGMYRAFGAEENHKEFFTRNKETFSNFSKIFRDGMRLVAILINFCIWPVNKYDEIKAAWSQAPNTKSPSKRSSTSKS